MVGRSVSRSVGYWEIAIIRNENRNLDMNRWIEDINRHVHKSISGELKRFQTNKTLTILETNLQMNVQIQLSVHKLLENWNGKQNSVPLNCLRFYIIYAFNQQKKMKTKMFCVFNVQCSMLNAQCLCLNRLKMFFDANFICIFSSFSVNFHFCMLFLGS